MRNSVRMDGEFDADGWWCCCGIMGRFLKGMLQLLQCCSSPTALPMAENTRKILLYLYIYKYIYKYRVKFWPLHSLFENCNTATTATASAKTKRMSSKSRAKLAWALPSRDWVRGTQIAGAMPSANSCRQSQQLQQLLIQRLQRFFWFYFYLALVEHQAV